MKFLLKNNFWKYYQNLKKLSNIKKNIFVKNILNIIFFIKFLALA